MAKIELHGLDRCGETEEFDQEAYEREVLAEVEAELRVSSGNGDFEVIAFYSHSKGRGRPKRKTPREVILVRYGASFYWFKRGAGPGNGLDEVAEEIFEGRVGSEDAFDLLVEEVERRVRKKSGY